MVFRVFLVLFPKLLTPLLRNWGTHYQPSFAEEKATGVLSQHITEWSSNLDLKKIDSGIEISWIKWLV